MMPAGSCENILLTSLCALSVVHDWLGLEKTDVGWAVGNGRISVT